MIHDMGAALAFCYSLDNVELFPPEARGTTMFAH